MTRSGAAPRAPTFEAVPIPAPILEHQRNVTLCVDFFFVQGLGFLHTISRGIGFRTVVPVADRSYKTILKEVTRVINIYQTRGLNVLDVHADSEFACLREALRPISMNIVTADSHVGEVERSIRTIKERLRSCVHGLPYKRLPKVMIRHLVSDTVRCLNQFPWRNGVSETLSPATIVLGVCTPDYTAMRIEFGAYVQVFEDSDPTNTPRARSMGAIALDPTGNAQGAYHFMSLATGARISRHRWTELPATDTAIARVEAIALHDGQPLIQDSGIVVEWRPDQPIDDSEYDSDYQPPNAAPVDDVLAPPDYDPIDADELADLSDDDLGVQAEPALAPQGALIVDDEDHDDHDNADKVDEDEGDDDNDAEDEDNSNDGDDDDANGNIAEIGDSDDEGDNGINDTDERIFREDEVDDDAMGEPVDNVVDDGTSAQSRERAEHMVGREEIVPHAVTMPAPYNLRERKRPTTVRFNDAIDTPHNAKSYLPPNHQMHHIGVPRDHRKFAFEYIMTQMSAKAGIHKHGKAAEAALMKEFAQMKELNVYEPVHAITLTRAQRRAALRAINLIKEKRGGTLKGRTVADGRPQRGLYDRSETASPTVSTDGLLLTIIIDAYESRDVATADIAGAYLKALMKDFVVMKFSGETVNILCAMYPEYCQYVVMEGGVPVLYVRLIKAIYGCVKSALLWYELFSGTLQEMGFVLNPYDQCVANCDIDGKQCTIAWYVDDTKISHADPSVVTMIIGKLEAKFGKMTVTRGPEHVFLGMSITYNKQERTATITMKDYLAEAINESRLSITRAAPTPANKNLFDVDEASPPLTKDAGEVFHSVVAKLLYVSIRARMDLLLATSFLTTRVSKCTQQDQSKLKRLLEYIHGTLDTEYTVGADDLGRMRTWVDASYAVHPDMRSHTGGVISFGRGGVACKSGKQKLNTKSSTEAEFVGASDYLPNTIWVKMFMEAQGFQIHENILEQDNESAIRLEKNGRTSAGPKSGHINIRFFWLKD